MNSFIDFIHRVLFHNFRSTVYSKCFESSPLECIIKQQGHVASIVIHSWIHELCEQLTNLKWKKIWQKHKKTILSKWDIVCYNVFNQTEKCIIPEIKTTQNLVLSCAAVLSMLPEYTQHVIKSQMSVHQTALKELQKFQTKTYSCEGLIRTMFASNVSQTTVRLITQTVVVARQVKNLNNPFICSPLLDDIELWWCKYNSCSSLWQSQEWASWVCNWGESIRTVGVSDLDPKIQQIMKTIPQCFRFWLQWVDDASSVEHTPKACLQTYEFFCIFHLFSM